MNIIKTELEGALIIEPQVFGDGRGFFYESYQKERYREIGITRELVQDNVSSSVKGVIRGLHIQRGSDAQGKLIYVLKGVIMDVIVDCRKDSPTFGKYFSVELSDANKKQLWIPRGFAHGFEALSSEVLFTYKCDNYYNPKAEVGIIYNDPDIGIKWKTENPILSEKDLKNISFKDFTENYNK